MVGEKAINVEKVKVECPHCGAIQITKIYTFVSMLDASAGIFCFNCRCFFIRTCDGKLRKN